MAARISLLVLGALAWLDGSATGDGKLLMSRCDAPPPASSRRSLHDFEVTTLSERENVTMSTYAGRPLLVINVATY
jgi:hypothetical protein